MDPFFTVVVLNQTPDPERVIYQAMHQDYSPDFVTNDLKIPANYKDAVVKHLLEGNRGHYGPLEHPQISFGVGYFPHTVMQQARTHRVGVSFDVQCLAADTELTFVKTSGQLHKVKIGELYDLWTNGEQAIRDCKIQGRNGEAPGTYRRDCKKQLQRLKLRVLNEETDVFEISHLQNVLCSGTQPVYRLTLADGKTLDCTRNHRLFTSQGWQHMGEAIGLITDENHQVLAMTRDCEVMCNGVLRPDVLYSQKFWFVAQAQKGLTAQEIAQSLGCSVDVICYWAKQHGVKLSSAHLGSLKTIVGDGLYRDRVWLEGQLSQGQTVAEIATTAGCSIECEKRLMAHPVKIVKVEFLGIQMTYDLEVAGQWHNFVANGIVVHNSFRYTGEQISKLGESFLSASSSVSTGQDQEADDLTLIEKLFYIPATVKEGQAKTRQGIKPISPQALTIIVEQYRNQALAYYRLVHECGLPYEDARNIIGYGIRQHFVVSFNCRSLMHFLDLRAKDDAQKEIRDLCELILPHFEAWCPSVATWYVKNRWGKARLAP